jgi:hypothetical protein
MTFAHDLPQKRPSLALKFKLCVFVLSPEWDLTTTKCIRVEPRVAVVRKG